MISIPAHDNAPDTIWVDKEPYEWNWHEGHNDGTARNFVANYTRTETVLAWEQIASETPPMDGRWIVFAEISGDGVIQLAHVDCAVVEMDVWYIGTDLSMWTHWRYLEPAAPTQGAAT